ncbi:YciI family protein [Bremerella sp. JC770]|uniref:YciI family protein n=1 Tax=Bremerella sp. JC770 TaxID=3232137 RepID=UPI00345ABBAF
MKYMLLVYGAETSWTPESREDCMRKSMAICDELQKDGKLIASSPLMSVATSKTVRVRDGKSLVTTGPFAETTEQLGGYYVLDVETEEEALAIAARIPPASVGSVEVRPLEPLPE